MRGGALFPQPAVWGKRGVRAGGFGTKPCKLAALLAVGGVNRLLAIHEDLHQTAGGRGGGRGGGSASAHHPQGAPRHTTVGTYKLRMRSRNTPQSTFIPTLRTLEMRVPTIIQRRGRLRRLCCGARAMWSSRRTSCTHVKMSSCATMTRKLSTGQRQTAVVARQP